MKKFIKLLLLLVLAFSISTSLYAQDDREKPVKIIIKRPPPHRLNQADLWNVTIINSGKSFSAYLFGSMTNNENGEQIATGKTVSFEVKKGTTNFKVSDLPSIPDINYLSKDPKYKQSFMNTGGAPPGDYKICVELRYTNNSVAGEDCIEQKVTGGEAPQLISPRDEEELKMENPVFTWMHMKAPGSEQSYTLKIVELKGDESPENAMLKNKAFFEKEGITQQMFQYPSSAPKFEEGKRYAWMVRLGDLKSGIASFRRMSGVHLEIDVDSLKCTGKEGEYYFKIVAYNKTNNSFNADVISPIISNPPGSITSVSPSLPTPISVGGSLLITGTITYSSALTSSPEFEVKFKKVSNGVVYPVPGFAAGVINCVNCNLQNPSFENIGTVNNPCSGTFIGVSGWSAGPGSITTSGTNSPDIYTTANESSGCVGSTDPFHGSNYTGLSIGVYSSNYLTESLMGTLNGITSGNTYRFSGRFSIGTVRKGNVAVEVLLYSSIDNIYQSITWGTISGTSWQLMQKSFNPDPGHIWDRLVIKGAPYVNPPLPLSYVFIDSLNVCPAEPCSNAIANIQVPDTVCADEPLNIDISQCQNEQSYEIMVVEVDANDNTIGTLTSQWFVNQTAGMMDIRSWYSSKGNRFECGKWYRIGVAVSNQCTQWISSAKRVYICCKSNINCNCGKWGESKIEYDSTSGRKTARGFRCGKDITVGPVKGGSTFTVTNGFICEPKNCTAAYDWKLIDQTNSVVASGSSSTNIISVTAPNVTSTFRLIITPKCGNSICEACTLFIRTSASPTGTNCGNKVMGTDVTVCGGQDVKLCSYVYTSGSGVLGSSFTIDVPLPAVGSPAVMNPTGTPLTTHLSGLNPSKKYLIISPYGENKLTDGDNWGRFFDPEFFVNRHQNSSGNYFIESINSVNQILFLNSDSGVEPTLESPVNTSNFPVYNASWNNYYYTFTGASSLYCKNNFAPLNCWTFVGSTGNPEKITSIILGNKNQPSALRFYLYELCTDLTGCEYKWVPQNHNVQLPDIANPIFPGNTTPGTYDYNLKVKLPNGVVLTDVVSVVVKSSCETVCP